MDNRDDGHCLKCGNDLDSPSAAGAEDGVCGECIADDAAETSDGRSDYTGRP